MVNFKTQVTIIGGGPSGLLLSQLLMNEGIDTIILEKHTKSHVLSRIRAGVLESGTVEILKQAGVGERIDIDGFVHEGTYLSSENKGFRVSFSETVGKSVTIFGQTEVTKDLYKKINPTVIYNLTVDRNNTEFFEKLADRFVEHPNMVFTISNLHYSEAGHLKSNNESKQQNMNWSSIALDGDSSFGFYEQLRQLGPLLKENWRVEENKQGNTTYENPSVICIYRKDHEFTLDQIIPSKNESINEFDLVIVSQAYRSRASVEKKVNNVIKPMVNLLAPNGKMVAFHSYGNDPGLNAINQLWPEENPFPNNIFLLLSVVQ